MSRLDGDGPNTPHRSWDDAQLHADEKIKLAADPKICRVVMCSGKVYYDLHEEREKRGIDDVYLLRVEQLYPVPRKALVQELGRFPKHNLSGARRSRETWSLLVPGTVPGMGSASGRRAE